MREPALSRVARPVADTWRDSRRFQRPFEVYRLGHDLPGLAIAQQEGVGVGQAGGMDLLGQSGIGHDC